MTTRAEHFARFQHLGTVIQVVWESQKGTFFRTRIASAAPRLRDQVAFDIFMVDLNSGLGSPMPAEWAVFVSLDDIETKLIPFAQVLFIELGDTP